MKHLVGNIKKHRLGYLEQACERYAIMAYEVLRRELAMGFKSITYSYEGDDGYKCAGNFVATFIPWEQTNDYRHGHRSTEIQFRVCADPEEDHWILSGGIVRDIESGMTATIRFERGTFGRIALTIPEWYEIRFASGAYHTQEAVTPLNKEPWGNLHESVTI
ncbi:hypothetical protein HYT05_04085 [Candidatus Kaiserbacteria bacterium]|nr:hypothetical protein [Candidatus Kaiserbacteria bacterium]